MDNNLSFSKIVATPTLNSWSQAYNAGKLFAVLSLEKTHDLPTETESLNILGKDLLERLEQEFFVIEDKNLESIKKAVATVFENESIGVTTSFAAGAIVNNVLYLFCLGKAKVFIKRDAEIGLALESEDNSKNFTSSSGFLKEKDLIILATDAFSEIITHDDLQSGLASNDPAEITESLAPKVHKAENGKISAIVIKYETPQQVEEMLDEGIEESEEAKQEEQSQEQAQTSPFNKFLSMLKSIRIPSLKFQPTKKLFLVVAVIIVVIIISSISLTIQAQNNAKVKALFIQIYPEAQKKYEEGQSLADLNKSLSRDAFTAAQKILTDNQTKFPAKSQEGIQTQDLLTKVNAGLAQVSTVDKSGLDRSKLLITVENGSGVEGAAGKAADILKAAGYASPSTANADNYNYVGVTIKAKASQNGLANLLKNDLAKDYTITSATSDLPATSPTDAVVIIGK